MGAGSYSKFETLSMASHKQQEARSVCNISGSISQKPKHEKSHFASHMVCKDDTIDYTDCYTAGVLDNLHQLNSSYFPTFCFRGSNTNDSPKLHQHTSCFYQGTPPFTIKKWAKENLKKDRPISSGEFLTWGLTVLAPVNST